MCYSPSFSNILIATFAFLVAILEAFHGVPLDVLLNAYPVALLFAHPVCLNVSSLAAHADTSMHS